MGSRCHGRFLGNGLRPVAGRVAPGLLDLTGGQALQINRTDFRRAKMDQIKEVLGVAVVAAIMVALLVFNISTSPPLNPAEFQKQWQDLRIVRPLMR